MHKCLTIIATLVAASSAQRCNGEYGSYLNCIKSKLDANYGLYEREFGDDYKKLAFDCFSTNAADARDGKACVVKDMSALDSAFSARGPLGDCQFCLKLAQQVQQMFLDAPESTMKCIRTTVVDLIGQEMGKCVLRSDASFTMPTIPDFDEKSKPYRQNIIDNLGVFVQTDAVLARCERNSERRNTLRHKRSAYSNSQSCIDRRIVNGKPIWAQTCQAIKSCHSSVQSSCQSDFKRIEGIACNCIAQGQKELSDLVSSVGNELVEVAKATSAKGGSCGNDLSQWKVCQCKAVVNKVIQQNSDRIDVQQVFEKIIGCTNLPAAQKDLVSIDKFLNIGCGRLGAQGGAGLRAAAELATGVDFIAKLLDALVARVTRFCPNASCRV